uniref:Zinc finger protein 879 n=1 Tax=Ceratitis capitata TaxID=7213 RepID=W8C868_CERCA
MESYLCKLYRFCRTCKKDLNTTKAADTAMGIHIFETPQLAEKLAVCIQADVLATDDYPKLLCSNCYQKVSDFYQFREMCVESMQRFKQLLEGQKLLATSDIIVEETDIFENSTDSSQKCVKEHTERKKTVFKGRCGEIIEWKCVAETYSELEILAKEARDKNEAASEVDDVDNSSNNEPWSKESQAGSVDTAIKNNNKSRKVLTRSVTAKESAIYRCDICPARFFIEHRLNAHKREHEGLLPYPCTHEGCEKSFNRWNALSRHLQQHEGRQFQYACEQQGCDKVYKHKPTLVMHQRKHHKLGPELRSLICEICGKIFKTSTMLNDHRYIHKDTSERPYACDQVNCTRRFSNKDKLKVHLMRHAGIRNYVCPHCGMRKTTMNELKVHINYHTLERTWPCSFCTHVCNSAGNLKTHVRTVHERVKDYACRHCERTFAKPDTRKYHEMTHTGEKPNVCVECGKRFLQPAALRTHRKIHQRENVHGAKAKCGGSRKASSDKAKPEAKKVDMARVQCVEHVEGLLLQSAT